MPEVAPTTPQAEKFKSEIYPKLNAAAKFLLTPERKWAKTDDPEKVASMQAVFEKTAHSFFDLLSTDKDKKGVATAVLAGNDEQITNLLRELYPQSFKEKTYEDYFMVVKDAYEAFVEKYRTLLPDKTPTVFERLIKDTLGNQAKEMLQGKSGTVLPTVVTEPTPPVEVKHHQHHKYDK